MQAALICIRQGGGGVHHLCNVAGYRLFHLTIGKSPPATKRWLSKQASHIDTKMRWAGQDTAAL